MSAAREDMLGRVREALAGRDAVAHPGDFVGARPPGALDPDPLTAFRTLLTAAGAEVVEVGSVGEARAWAARFAAAFESVCVGATVPPELTPGRPAASADVAALAVSRARWGVAETGSLVLDARDGRRTQLLPPTHLVWLRAGDVVPTLREALQALRADPTSGIGLHSGPSKSADIGQILVRGVHGPGRLVVALLRD